MKTKIDFVMMWVDGSDREWLKEKNKYDDNPKNVDDSIERYRDMGTLKYWFRSIEKYTPWVNKIHFIVWKSIPNWLNTENPKLNIIKHEDYIPKQYLPTFSSHCIELNLHRIQDLSEHFVLFNDDMFILNPLSEEYFFKNDLPCDHWKENPFKTENSGDNFFDHIPLNNLFVINKNFEKNKVIKELKNKVYNLKYGKRNVRYVMLRRWNYFTGFEYPHTANSYLKSSFKDIWDKEYMLLDQTCTHRFRNILDVNQWVVNLWQMCNGNFSVKNHNDFGRYYSLSNNNDELINYMLSPTSTVVCINDSKNTFDFNKISNEIIDIFEKKLPEKSSFEK